jgi:chromosome segregation ATPase
MALEASAQELRAEKERLLRELVTARSERDESREAATRARHQIEALEEEHRRLSRMISASDPSSSMHGEQRIKLTDELRETKVELKTLRSESQRLKERLDRAEAERVEVDGRLAKLDVERAQALEEKQRAEAGRARADEARARAEAAKQRSEEERRAAAEARDSQLAASEEVRRNGEREKRRAAELEAQVERLRERVQKLEGERPTGDHEVSDQARMVQLEEELASLGAELALARAASVAGTASGLDELKRRAEAAHAGINDALSELRTNILVAKDLVAAHGRSVPDAEAARTLREAILVAVDRVEDCKKLLRSLREVIE